MNRTALTLSEIKSLNAQSWAEFRAHWPMHVLYLLCDIGGGFVFGVALALAAVVAVLDAAV
ncbi:MAG: hypothetical protein ACD_67C00023G0002 [uncultured bacterium]|nr:MAG: hypothetical protein ACD_67C00023G0002 [uncultured bacterium]